MRLLGDYIYLVAQLTYALIGVAQQRLFVGEREQMLRLMVGRQGPEPSAFTTCDYYYYHARNYSTQKTWLLDTAYARISVNGGMYIRPKTNMKKHTNQTAKKRTKNIAIIVVALSVGLLLGGYLYTSGRAESPDVAQKKVLPANKVDPTSSGSEAGTPTNSTAEGKPAAGQASTLPVPILSKSSGNNSSVPGGTTINFTCVSIATYYCEVKLTRSGPEVISLEKKQLAGELSQYGANWYWESISGTWSVTAVLSNGSGQTKSSAAQTLEVR